jgi:thiosulfate/3-mercaptopyruvate sulfurtransferase
MSRRPAVLISAAELAALLEAAQQPVVADVRWTLGGPPGKPGTKRAIFPALSGWISSLTSPIRRAPAADTLPPVAVFEQAMRDIGVRQIR